MFPWSGKPRQNSKHTYTPARQRAMTRRSYAAAALAVVVVILALSQFGEDGLATYLKLRSHENELVQDVRQLEDQNAALQEKMLGLATDEAILEKLARENHNMQHRHEEVLTVFPETSKSSDPE